MQRLKKVGIEFGGEQSTNLMDSMKAQSMAFFKRYHASSLEEICLFLDHEAWVPVQSFSSIEQLQEFRSVKKSLRRHFVATTNESAAEIKTSTISMSSSQLHSTTNHISSSHRKMLDTVDDNASSIHSLDGSSSIYGSCGYFFRFSEKSSPFDGGFDAAMLEEDILAGIADESSCYFSEESEEEHSLNSAAALQNGVSKGVNGQTVDGAIIVNNSSLNVLRCIGRYLQMCKLLHSIAPLIIVSMAELIDFYIYVVHDIFGNDLVRVKPLFKLKLLWNHLNGII